jgi:hypothetical protein
VKKYTYVTGPLTRAQVEAMTADQANWHSLYNTENMNKALVPPVAPVPPAPPTEAQIREQLKPEYDAWLNVQTLDHPGSLTWDMFLKRSWAIFMEWREKTKNQILADFSRFTKDHPDYAITEKNRERMNYWLNLSNLSATYDNLVAAYSHLKCTGGLTLNKIEPPPDPNKPETRAGVWSGGRFTPFDTSAGGSGVEKPYSVGQIDPSKAASDEKQVSKSVRQQTSAEYLRNLKDSPSFRKEMDGR